MASLARRRDERALVECGSGRDRKRGDGPWRAVCPDSSCRREARPLEREGAANVRIEKEVAVPAITSMAFVFRKETKRSARFSRPPHRPIILSLVQGDIYASG